MESTAESDTKSSGNHVEVTTAATPPSGKKPEALPLPQFIKSLSDQNIDERVRERIVSELEGMGKVYGDVAEKYCIMSLYEPEGAISSWEASRIFRALQSENGDNDKKKDILLVIRSPGGKIEPAYQISKLCKAYAKDKFVVAVPREAKSAATLLVLGADQIHMGLLGELGPIDPQIDKLPALGVKRALETIAVLSQQYPGCEKLFSRYLSLTVTVEQIGYCERVAESAVQYAERLLEKKPEIKPYAKDIAKRLVYEYKDHGFVIDVEEVRRYLGRLPIVESSSELQFAEGVNQLFDRMDLFLGLFHKKRLIVVGDVKSGSFVWDRPSSQK